MSIILNLDTDFSYQTIDLPDDYEGKVTATLIAANANTGNRKSVLYVHGFIDYFFQTHMAAKFLDKGFDFYALELRKYGNSLLPHQHPNYCRDITEYFSEISISLKQIFELSNHKITLVGHSTGGLTTSLYMNEGDERELVDALILNSPFLEFNISKLKRLFLPVISKLSITFNKYAKLNEALSRVYSQSIHKDDFGEWDFSQYWKPIKGFPAYYAWTNAVLKAQYTLKSQSDIQVPILIMHSNKSLITKKYTEEASNTDTVLNVEHIKKYGATLGAKVTLVEIQNGMHDLVLSRKEVREVVFQEMFSWLKNLD